VDEWGVACAAVAGCATSCGAVVGDQHSGAGGGLDSGNFGAGDGRRGAWDPPGGLVCGEQSAGDVLVCKHDHDAGAPNRRCGARGRGGGTRGRRDGVRAVAAPSGDAVGALHWPESRAVVVCGAASGAGVAWGADAGVGRASDGHRAVAV
jgi:hypothetical protein